jgi:MoaD family protein
LIVTVRFDTTLREVAGYRAEALTVHDGSTLADLLEVIAATYAAARTYLYHDGAVRKTDPSLHFLINGRNARGLAGLKTPLKHQDVVEIVPIPPMVGGG